MQHNTCAVCAICCDRGHRKRSYPFMANFSSLIREFSGNILRSPPYVVVAGPVGPQTGSTGTARGPSQHTLWLYTTEKSGIIVDLYPDKGNFFVQRELLYQVEMIARRLKNLELFGMNPYVFADFMKVILRATRHLKKLSKNVISC